MVGDMSTVGHGVPVKPSASSCPAVLAIPKIFEKFEAARAGVEPAEPPLGSCQIISLLGLPMPDLADIATKTQRALTPVAGVEPANHPD